VGDDSSTPNKSSAKVWFMIIFCQARGPELGGKRPGGWSFTYTSSASASVPQVRVGSPSTSSHSTIARRAAVPIILTHHSHSFLPASLSRSVSLCNQSTWVAVLLLLAVSKLRPLRTSSTQRGSGTITSGQLGRPVAYLIQLLYSY